MFARPRFGRQLLLFGAVAAVAGTMGCTKAPESADAEDRIVSPNKSHAAAKQHWEAARKLAAAGDYEAALPEYTAALHAFRLEQPAVENARLDADLLVERGVAYLAAGFPDTAAADFTEALRIQPEHGPALVRRGEAHAKLRDYFKAVRDCTEGIRCGEPTADAYRYRGEAYLARRQFDRAAADLEQAVALEPAVADQLRPLMAAAYRGWGEQLSEAGAAAEAEAKLAQAEALEPSVDSPADSEALFNSSVERTAAKLVLDEAREPYERGLQEYEDRRFDEALESFTTAIDRQPDFAEAYLARAKTLMAADFPDTAVADLDQAIRYGGSAVEPLWLKAQAFMMLEAPDRAVLAATDALHLDPTIADCYAVRGKAYFAIDNWQRAAADLEEAVRRDAALAVELAQYLDRARRLRDAINARQVEAEPEATRPDPIVNRPSA